MLTIFRLFLRYKDPYRHARSEDPAGLPSSDECIRFDEAGRWERGRVDFGIDRVAVVAGAVAHPALGAILGAWR